MFMSDPNAADSQTSQDSVMNILCNSFKAQTLEQRNDNGAFLTSFQTDDFVENCLELGHTSEAERAARDDLVQMARRKETEKDK
jgi:hypothetical protein